MEEFHPWRGGGDRGENARGRRVNHPQKRQLLEEVCSDAGHSGERYNSRTANAGQKERINFNEGLVQQKTQEKTIRKVDVTRSAGNELSS